MARVMKQGISLNISEIKGCNRQTTIKSIRTTLRDKYNTQEKFPAKRAALFKKSNHVPKALPLLDDPDLPPPPQQVPAKQTVNATVVTWDMESASDSFASAVDAIGAYCPLEKLDNDGMIVSRVATQGCPTNNQAGDRVNLPRDYELWTQDEKQCLESFVKWLANISGKKCNSKGSGDAATDGVVLLSFGGISARIPKLLLALRRHKLLTQFENVVVGICDVNTVSLETNPPTPIETDAHEDDTPDPAVQSRHFYRITAHNQKSEKKFIACNLHPLARNVFAPSYVMKLSVWRLKTDHRATDLRAVVTTRVGKSVKRKRSLVKNLLAVGYDYGSLRKQYEALGEFVFREVLLNKLRHMKQCRESNLTDTREVGCKTVIESVVDHFKELQRERILKRAPPSD